MNTIKKTDIGVVGHEIHIAVVELDMNTVFEKYIVIDKVVDNAVFTKILTQIGNYFEVAYYCHKFSVCTTCGDTSHDWWSCKENPETIDTLPEGAVRI